YREVARCEIGWGQPFFEVLHSQLQLARRPAVGLQLFLLVAAEQSLEERSQHGETSGVIDPFELGARKAIRDSQPCLGSSRCAAFGAGTGGKLFLICLVLMKARPIILERPVRICGNIVRENRSQASGG